MLSRGKNSPADSKATKPQAGMICDCERPQQQPNLVIFRGREQPVTPLWLSACAR